MQLFEARNDPGWISLDELLTRDDLSDDTGAAQLA
jgi:hypothetical protein